MAFKKLELAQRPFGDKSGHIEHGLLLEFKNNDTNDACRQSLYIVRLRI
jgi:hypothetical protein